MAHDHVESTLITALITSIWDGLLSSLHDRWDTTQKRKNKLASKIYKVKLDRI